MSKNAHFIYIATMSLVVGIVFAYLAYSGYTYYKLPLEERFYHDSHMALKPSGIVGHGLGIIGTLLIIIGVLMYMIRKRSKKMARWGLLKHWLEFHIFLCTLGPIMVLFHTSFKFGGIVAISFWSMVAVFLSGVIGRFIYIQIPRTIEGRELSLNEVVGMKSDVGSIIQSYNLDDASYHVIVDAVKEKRDESNNILANTFKNFLHDRKKLKNVKRVLKINSVPKQECVKVLNLVGNEISLNRKIKRLSVMQNLFKYWHVAHLPFAIVMMIIMVIHVVITIVFGYKWIF